MRINEHCYSLSIVVFFKQLYYEISLVFARRNDGKKTTRTISIEDKTIYLALWYAAFNPFAV